MNAPYCWQCSSCGNTNAFAISQCPKCFSHFDWNKDRTSDYMPAGVSNYMHDSFGKGKNGEYGYGKGFEGYGKGYNKGKYPKKRRRRKPKGKGKDANRNAADDDKSEYETDYVPEEADCDHEYEYIGREEFQTPRLPGNAFGKGPVGPGEQRHFLSRESSWHSKTSRSRQYQEPDARGRQQSRNSGEQSRPRSLTNKQGQVVLTRDTKYIPATVSDTSKHLPMAPGTADLFKTAKAEAADTLEDAVKCADMMCDQYKDLYNDVHRRDEAQAKRLREACNKFAFLQRRLLLKRHHKVELIADWRQYSQKLLDEYNARRAEYLQEWDTLRDTLEDTKHLLTAATNEVETVVHAITGGDSKDGREPTGLEMFPHPADVPPPNTPPGGAIDWNNAKLKTDLTQPSQDSYEELDDSDLIQMKKELEYTELNGSLSSQELADLLAKKDAIIKEQQNRAGLAEALAASVHDTRKVSISEPPPPATISSALGEQVEEVAMTKSSKKQQGRGSRSPSASRGVRPSIVKPQKKPEESDARLRAAPVAPPFADLPNYSNVPAQASFAAMAESDKRLALLSLIQQATYKFVTLTAFPDSGSETGDFRNFQELAVAHIDKGASTEELLTVCSDEDTLRSQVIAAANTIRNSRKGSTAP